MFAPFQGQEKLRGHPEVLLARKWEKQDTTMRLFKKRSVNIRED